MVPRTRPCDAETRAGRLRIARQFDDAARLVEEWADDAVDVGNAFVTLCVHAGIAYADVICCARLGYHAQGENHTEAVAIVRKADREASTALSVLLRLKTRAGYSHKPIPPDDLKRAGRALDALREVALRV